MTDKRRRARRREKAGDLPAEFVEHLKTKGKRVMTLEELVKELAEYMEA